MTAYQLPTHTPLVEPDADIPSVHEAKAEAKLAKKALKRAKAEAIVAKRRAALAKAEGKLELQSEHEGRSRGDLDLARRGYRRDIFGRIVPVKASSRARAHLRRL